MTASVAVAQFRATADKAANLEIIGDLVADAAGRGAALVVLPENAMAFDPTPGADARAWAEPVDGPFADAIAGLAREHRITIVAGMTESLPGEERASNTLLAVGPDGASLGVYRKVHLYDAFGYRESDRIRAAAVSDPLLFDLGGVRFGAMTCYDLRFPEMARWLVDAGAEALVLPAAWAVGPAKEDHWTTLIRARAIENTVSVLAAGQTGPACTGQSMVVDPMGVVLAGAGEAPGVAIAQLDPERLAAVRERNPSLANRRFTVSPTGEPVEVA
jgi:predicted amidohydrolase